MGRIVSINVAQPRTVPWKGRQVRTSFFKQPVTGPVGLGWTNLEGDAQADRRVHGGPAKAVYVYPSEHYAHWAGRLGVLDLPWGSFGENLTIQGFREDDVRQGDTFRAGSATLCATKPREPCFKMNLRFQRDDAVRLFAQAGRPGFYCRVVKPGSLSPGDVFERISSGNDHPTMAALFRRTVEAKAAVARQSPI